MLKYLEDNGENDLIEKLFIEKLNKEAKNISKNLMNRETISYYRMQGMCRMYFFS